MFVQYLYNVCILMVMTWVILEYKSCYHVQKALYHAVLMAVKLRFST